MFFLELFKTHIIDILVGQCVFTDELLQPHIGAPVSCWSKYLEEDSENSCVKQEEEEDNGLIYTDREHIYTRQNIISEAR